MAKAEVVITAVDRTKAALAQAERGMKGLEKTAKVTGKAINLAFGLITGGLLVSAFGKVAEAAKKTEEGQKAMAELARTLKDPALVAAANAITSTLIQGFNVAIKAAATAIKFVRAELIKLGAMDPNGTARDVQSIIEGQLRAARSASTMAIGEPGGDLTPIEQANAIAAREAARARIPLLEKQLELVRGLADAEAAADRARIDRELAAEAAASAKEKKPGRSAGREKSVKDVSAEIRRAAAEHRQKMFSESMDDLEKHLSKTIDEVDFTLNVKMTESVAKLMEERIQGLTEAVSNAAVQMRDAFADFLFDPFQNGLRGMLSGFLNIVRRMVADLAAQALLKSFFGAFSGGTGIMGDIARAALTGLGGRAMGGPVAGNTPYIVGERGPELFMPSTSGSIVPNHKLGGGMTVAPVYNIDARGATMELTQALPTILADNNRRIFDELDRRYGIRR